MRASLSAFRCVLVVATLVATGLPGDRAAAGSKRVGRDPVGVGRALFHREWVPNDPRAHGGDGLGPMYNAMSCVECHNLGGPGGAGTKEHDVELAIPMGLAGADVMDRPTNLELKGLLKKSGIHADGAFVLHHFANDPLYPLWRETITGFTNKEFRIKVVSRNTPAIFGAGLIDAIPERVIKEAALRIYSEFPSVHGRVNRLEDGRIGRFGWKAQTASLRDFVLTACAVELGLEVPDHHQGRDVRILKMEETALDLTDDDCNALVAFVRSIPRPAQAAPATPEEMAGSALFQTIGCASCHTPDLGNVAGLYSDLLIHDMGTEDDEVGESFNYYGGSGSSAPARPAIIAGSGVTAPTGQEWRTPPLWGLRHSAPYMHDGAETSLAGVLNRHRGEATESAARYDRLSKFQKIQVQDFLLSLEAPHQPRPKKTPEHRLLSHAVNSRGDRH